VIEQEAGVAELDASDRALIWGLMGGEQRYLTGFADVLVEDDLDAIATEVRCAFAAAPAVPRSEQVERFIERLSRIDPGRSPEPRALRAMWPREDGR
jgi:malonate decarboxylase beta subunit